MNVTSKIAVDLTRANIGARVNAVQGDGNTRSVDITLLADGNPWTAPGGVEAAIAYRQPSGTKGLYNLLADGTAAISITGNVATIVLAPQMLTASGTVQASLVFNDSQLNRLTTFPFSVSVTSNPAAGAQKTEDYIRLQWLEDKLDEYLKKYEDEATVQRIVNEYLSANPPKVTETDPTVPDWAKQPQKPTYTADEVHALPDTYTPPNQTAQQVGADPAGTAASAVSQHNTDTAAHNDLRLALQGLSDRINAALDSDDTTLDQMSEVVAYIKSNKSLIDAITTSKVSVADIVNDLVTNVADKPLSAAQGVALKRLIDNLEIIAGDVDKKLDKPETAPEVGKILQVIAVNDDGTFTCAWADAPIGGVADVQISGKSIVSDGVAEIPFAGNAAFLRGSFSFHPNYGLGLCAPSRSVFGLENWTPEWWETNRSGKFYSDNNIDHKAVTSSNVDYAVKLVMCDGKGVPWTDVERIAALLRMGCTVDDNGFVKWGEQGVTG